MAIARGTRVLGGETRPCDRDRSAPRVHTDVVQRWRSGRDLYRPAREVIDVSRFEVASIPDDTTAKRFVTSHHYSGSYPAARFRFGLYQGELLAGVAVFSMPAQPRCLDVLPGERLASVELGRFVLLDDVGANAETWFLGRSFELLRREGITGVVSFSDPVPRTDGAGHVVFPGHIGTIYQAHNATYLGKSKRRTMRLLPDGTCLHPRALAKLRTGDRGWRYVVGLLEEHGAERLGSADRVAWAQRWVRALTHEVRHGGNHKYVWSLDRRLRRRLPASIPYPKILGVS